MPFGLTWSPLKLTMGDTKGRRFFWVKLHLLEGCHIHDVCRTFIVDQYSISVASFYCKHNYQRIVIRLFHSFGIMFWKHDVLYSGPSTLHHWVSCMNIVNLSLVGSSQRFEQPPVTGPLVIILISPTVDLTSFSSSSLT